LGQTREVSSTKRPGLHYEVYAVKPSPGAHKITLSRCRARNRCRGSYFDPATFDVTTTLAGVVFAVAESPEQGEVGGVDEVLFDCCLRNMADSRFPRSIDCSSSY